MLNDDCVFCRIIRGEIPARKVYEDDMALVFEDIEPKAKIHLLAVPKTHFARLSEAGAAEAPYIARLFEKIPSVAAANGCGNGYRLVINQGEAAGQTVPHLHVHILGGQTLGW